MSHSNVDISEASEENFIYKLTYVLNINNEIASQKNGLIKLRIKNSKVCLKLKLESQNKRSSHVFVVLL